MLTASACRRAIHRVAAHGLAGPVENGEVRRILGLADIKEKLLSQSTTPLPMSPAEIVPPPPPPPADAKPANEGAQAKPVSYLEEKLPSAPPPPLLSNVSLLQGKQEKK